MAEVAMAGVSLTFQVFSGVVQGYQLITDAKNMPSDCQYLRVRLKTEQYRLLDWAHVVRLEETDDHLLISNASKGLLLDVLDQQRRLFEQFGRLDDKYKKLTKPLLVEAAEENGLLLDAPASSHTEPRSPTVGRVDSDFQRRFPQSERLLDKSLAWAKKGAAFPRKMKWASFDKAKMENLVLKLASFNDFMRDMLNTHQLQTLASKQTRTEFQIMQLNSSIQNLVQIFESAALTAKYDHRRARYPTNPIRAFMQARGLEDIDEEDADSLATANGSQSLAFLAQFKALNSAIDDPSVLTDEFTTSIRLTHTASQIRSVELSRADIHILDAELHEPSSSNNIETLRVEAFYQPPRSKKTSVWIEWKTYEPPTFHSTRANPKVLERVQALAALLKENNKAEQFRAPHCLGYFQDADPATGEEHCRFGLVFEKPASAHPSTRPMSLHTLLTLPDVAMPSLTARIALMRRLAETLERLHAVNWLHKGLRSANILFFSDCGAHDIPYADPYISGFDYSRPALSDDMTEKPPENAAADIYRHPRVQGAGNRDSMPSTSTLTSTSTTAPASGGFKKSYDLYSLGVVLLEIAYWQPIDAILSMGDLSSTRPSTTIRVRGRLLDDSDSGEGVLPHVRSHLGDTVERVVRACLEGPVAFGVVAAEGEGEGPDERREEVGARLQRGFYERVVRELGEMRV
ncbi:prion-inhibition and propagation-domain-containing protein [Massariosphaeria phaeospora]|uniref:Prion-inhibition and propagation-domain-containing protein n=1 Tax=Massariosphaeria phaeospora TaxID=100035 RepID=A0A7C8I3G3_9PLEO|nr:prion-inhibition and propagation-domain-containing protein [Massariosphaeria phaeospora]